MFEDYPKGRCFMIDSGASFHMSGRKFISAIEKQSIRMLEVAVELTTANRIVYARLCATMYVQSLDLSVEVMIVPDIPPILSPGIFDEKEQLLDALACRARPCHHATFRN